MTLKEKLNKIQTEFKAPKGQFNSFGKYKYRSAEDILESIKPFLKTEKINLLLTDKVEEVGGRVYVTATVKLIDIESDEEIKVRASAREADIKKGMDSAQVTGAASSYARKYAMNGLFCIDDTKDVDTDEHKKKEIGAEKQANNIGNELKESKEKLDKVKNWGEIKKLSDELITSKDAPLLETKDYKAFAEDKSKLELNDKNTDDIISILSALVDEKKLTK